MRKDDMQHIQEGKKIVKCLNRYLEDIGVWQPINIKDTRGRREERFQYKSLYNT